MPDITKRATLFSIVIYERKRLLIIAKTYPELSSRYVETVCTAAVDENGTPYRLYPIPFRYLAGNQRFERYQWIDVAIQKSEQDSRPESFRVDTRSISLLDKVGTTSDEWGRRREFVLRQSAWQFSSMSALLEAQEKKGTSLAFIYPNKIKSIEVKTRDTKDATSFQDKLQHLRAENNAKRAQLDLFEKATPSEMKSLAFVSERVCVDWFCSDVDCLGHSMQVLDWEICELARSRGVEAARQKVLKLLTDEFRTGFMLGNFNMYRHNFAIIGVWYPKRSNLLF